MRSHNYEFTALQVLRLIAPALLVIVVFSLSMHAAAKARLLPNPKPTLDMDRTILLHKAEASLQPSGANIVLIGDSSCMMDAFAPDLQKQLATPVLNLGTLSYLDLTAQSELVRNYVTANSNTVKAVVLLMHPESLRLGSRNPYFSEVLRSFFERRDICDSRASKLVCWMGGDILKGRILSRTIPVPLPGVYGQYYGSTWNLWWLLKQNQGSAIEPKRFDAKAVEGSPEYRLSKELENASKSFRSALKPGVKLLVGITPSPAGFVLPSHDQVCAEMLRQWAEWLQADGALTPLPCSLPDNLFATKTHLNEAGAKEFTATLARALDQHLPRQNR